MSRLIRTENEALDKICVETTDTDICSTPEIALIEFSAMMQMLSIFSVQNSSIGA
jgi:hypothetical protein